MRSSMFLINAPILKTLLLWIEPTNRFVDTYKAVLSNVEPSVMMAQGIESSEALRITHLERPIGIGR